MKKYERKLISETSLNWLTRKINDKYSDWRIVYIRKKSHNTLGVEITEGFECILEREIES